MINHSFAFNIQKDHPNMAIAEIEALTGIKHKSKAEDFIIIETEQEIKKDILCRLAYTSNVYKILFESTISKLEDNMNKYPWQKIYKKDFCIRIHNKESKKLSEKELAGFIWRSVKKPKVNLKNPRTLIEIFIVKNKAYACLHILEIKSDFEKRKAHLRPRLHPSSMHPKLSRAMINITGIKDKRVSLVDPFCGSGGVLIEAELMGLKSKGYDIDKIMIERAKENLAHYKLNYNLKLQDSLKLKQKIRFIATDLPYGKSTKTTTKLFEDFIKMLEKCLIEKAVVGFPSSFDPMKSIKSKKLKVEKCFDYYIHKSLSKKIVIISKDTN